MRKQDLVDALNQIAQIAQQAAGSPAPTGGGEGPSADQYVGCILKALPERLAARAARTAAEVSPANQPMLEAAFARIDRGVDDIQRLTLMTTKYWGAESRRLTVRFLDGPSAALRRKILEHMNAWEIGVRFAETTGTGHVRITRNHPNPAMRGHWSYLGTDILHIAPGEATMSLFGFTERTPDSEFFRVVRHETGHTLGFAHEHMRAELVSRIDPRKAYDFFLRTQGWNRAKVDQQVLTALDARSVFGTPADQDSIMCYQLPGTITKDGRPIRGGADINATDRRFARRLYPSAAGGTSFSRDSAPAGVERDAGFAAGADDATFTDEPYLEDVLVGEEEME